MLVVYTGKGVTPEVNLREYILPVPLPNVNKAALSGFETQRRYHQKSKTGVSVTPQKGLISSKKLYKKNYKEKHHEDQKNVEKIQRTGLQSVLS